MDPETTFPEDNTAASGGIRSAALVAETPQKETATPVVAPGNSVTISSTVHKDASKAKHSKKTKTRHTRSSIAQQHRKKLKYAKYYQKQDQQLLTYDELKVNQFTGRVRLHPT